MSIEKTKKEIPYGRHQISQKDIDAVVGVLNSDFLTQGPEVEKFEHSLSVYCGSKYTVAVNSATSALHIACCAANVCPGDKVWVPANSFVATANCAKYCGAVLDFVDINLDDGNISIEDLQRKLEHARINGELPKLVIAVDFAGIPCDLKRIRELSNIYGFKLILDASHALGAIYEGNRVGSNRYSDFTVFSFHPVKIIATGEGGAVTTNSDQDYERLKLLRSHGVSRFSKAHYGNLGAELWSYEQVTLGYNYRLSDIHAALGNSQLSRINYFLKKRVRQALHYKESLSGLPIKSPVFNLINTPSFHLYVIQIPTKDNVYSRNNLYQYLTKVGIQCNFHYIPIYRHPFYEREGFFSGYCKNAEIWFREMLTIPLFPAFSHSDQEYVINQIKEFFE